jgi:nucleoside-diphosphate-sugar epimerase
LVDAALATTPQVYVQPTVTFVYPGEGPVDEATEIAEVPATLRSALVAEKEAARFAEAGRRGVVLRLGLLYGPGTGSDEPRPELYGAALHVEDAATALRAALDAPTGIFNVVADHGRVSNERFKAVTNWRPRHA